MLGGTPPPSVEAPPRAATVASYRVDGRIFVQSPALRRRLSPRRGHRLSRRAPRPWRPRGGIAVLGERRNRARGLSDVARRLERVVVVVVVVVVVEVVVVVVFVVVVVGDDRRVPLVHARGRLPARRRRSIRRGSRPRRRLGIIIRGHEGSLAGWSRRARTRATNLENGFVPGTVTTSYTFGRPGSHAGRLRDGGGYIASSERVGALRMGPPSSPCV